MIRLCKKMKSFICEEARTFHPPRSTEPGIAQPNSWEGLSTARHLLCLGIKDLSWVRASEFRRPCNESSIHAFTQHSLRTLRGGKRGDGHSFLGVHCQGMLMPCGSRRMELTGYQRLHKIRENVRQALGGPLGVGEDSGEMHRAVKICKDEMQRNRGSTT